MMDVRRQTFVALVAVSALACSTMDDVSTSSVGPTATVSAPPTCDLDGKLEVRITGLPNDLTPTVTVQTQYSGSDTFSQEFHQTETSPLPPTSFDVRAPWVTNADPIVHTVYVPEIGAVQHVCSGAGAIVDVAFVANPASGKLWMSGTHGLGFPARTLEATGAPRAGIVTGRAAGGIAFDDGGNLWGFGGTDTDPTIVRYPAASLRSSGDKPAEIEIWIAASACSSSPGAVALDMNGGLWFSQPCEKRVVSVADNMKNNSPDTRLAIGRAVSGLTAPRGIAFDRVGEMWIADGTAGVARVDPVDVDSATSDISKHFVVMPGATANWIAFDEAGDLWITLEGSTATLARFDHTMIYGDATPPPSTTLSLGPDAKPSGIAFDESGAMWIAGAPTPDKIARLTQAQLKTPSTDASPTIPDRVLESADITATGFLAFYPAHVGLPFVAAKQQ